MAVCTARRMARRNETRPWSCSATPCANSWASVSGRDSVAAWFMSSTLTSTRLAVIRSRSLRTRSTSAPLRPITMPGRADIDLDLVALALDVDARDAGARQVEPDVVPDGDVLVERGPVVLLAGVPPRLPRVDHPEAEAVGINLLPQPASPPPPTRPPR